MTKLVPEVSTSRDGSVPGLVDVLKDIIVRKRLWIQTSWSAEIARVHINVLETETMTRTNGHWSRQLQGHRVTVMSDISTTVSYTSRQGGARSRPLLERIWRLLIRYEELRVNIKAAHRTGKDNTVAETLSRGTFRRTEWSLLQSWADHVSEMSDRPQP